MIFFIKSTSTSTLKEEKCVGKMILFTKSKARKGGRGRGGGGEGEGRRWGGGGGEGEGGGRQAVEKSARRDKP